MKNVLSNFNKKPLQVTIILLVSIFILCFFSFRILDVPTGFTVDEVAFGYNAALLAGTAHDQNDRYMPLFVESIEGKDWRQPVTQYYMAAFFKLFGNSVFNLRFSSVVITLFSSLLIYYLAKIVLNRKWAIIAVLLFLTTPLVMIQSHMGLDNIMPIPFVLLWLLGIALYEKNGSLKFLLLSGIGLGIGFYTYKGMRATAPAWSIVTFFYLLWPFWQGRSKKSFNSTVKALLVFGLGIAPFYIAAPILEGQYPRAVFDSQGLKWDNFYTFIYPYFSSYDLSFLFIKGDDLIYHSTGRHGMMLLSSMPLFFAGVYQAIVKRKFWLLVLVAFLTAPSLYGFVNSVHRASRLMAMIPPYVLIATLGACWLWQKVRTFSSTRKFLALLVLLFIVNYTDFLYYYWFQYPKDAKYAFGDMKRLEAYTVFYQLAKEKNLQPLIDQKVFSDDGEEGRFYSAMYFGKKVDLRFGMAPPEQNQILLSNKEKIYGLEQLGTEVQGHRYFVKQ